MLNQGIITGRLTKDVELKKVNDRVLTPKSWTKNISERI